MTHAPTRRLAMSGLVTTAASVSLGGLAFAQMDPLAARSAANRVKSSPLTVKDEAQAGAKQYGPSIDAMGGAYPNRALQSAVQRVAEPILKTSARRDLTWEITVIDSSEVNAWCLPGGKMGINKGLLRYVDNEDELAAVIAHEMGHAEMSHIVEEQKGKQIAGLFLGAITAAAASSSDNSVSVGAGALAADVGLLSLATSAYSRDHEREADKHIATVFAKTGHSIAGGAGFYRTLLELIPANSRGRTSLFAGHPETRERLAALMALAPATPPPPKSSPAFVEVKTAFPTRKAYLRG